MFLASLLTIVVAVILLSVRYSKQPKTPVFPAADDIAETDVHTVLEAPSQIEGTPITKWSDGFSLNIVGESHYQGEVRRCRIGEPVTLRREPENPYDENAVAVFSVRSCRIGHLSRDRAHWIGGKMDNGVAVRAQIELVTGLDQPHQGILLKVWLE